MGNFNVLLPLNMTKLSQLIDQVSFTSLALDSSQSI